MSAVPEQRCELCRFWTPINPAGYTGRDGQLKWARCDLHSDIERPDIPAGGSLVSPEYEDDSRKKMWTAWRFGCVQHEPREGVSSSGGG